MIEFDLVLKAMGLYKYIIYAFERAEAIAAIRHNQQEMSRISIQAKDSIAYYQGNIREFARRLRRNEYRVDAYVGQGL